MTLCRMLRVLPAAVLSLTMVSAVRVAVAQTAASGAANSDAQVKVPQLDVISVKPNRSVGGGMSMGPLTGTNVTAHMVLTQAFHLNENQVVNEPDWAKSDRFDIKAKVADADEAIASKLTQDQQRGYFQQVLKERFGLVAHHETRELPEYELVAAKGGVKLVDGKADPNVSPDMRSGGFRTDMRGGVEKIDCANMPSDLLLQFLSNQTGRKVVDKVGLTGKYSYTLTFRPAMGPAPADAAADSTPDVFTAIQEQLGLKLEPAKGPVDVLVIDHIERPKEN